MEKINNDGCEGCKYLTGNNLCKVNLKEIGEFQKCLSKGDCCCYERGIKLGEAKRIQCNEMINRLPDEEIEKIRKYLMEIWRKYHKLEEINS